MVARFSRKNGNLYARLTMQATAGEYSFLTALAYLPSVALLSKVQVMPL